MATDADQQAMRRVRQGDRRAEHELYVAHIAAAVRCAARVGAQPADAEDYAHEAFIKVIARLRRGDGPTGPFRAYLNAAVRNVAVDAHRGQRGREAPTAEGSPLTAEVATRLGPHDEVEIRHTVRAAMAALSADLREMLWRLDVEGEPAARVAADAGVAVETLVARAYRARKAVRKAYASLELSA
jgi:RNA polymerase sigma factor (sigma-70 family)